MASLQRHTLIELAMLTSAATASAECSWVLWSKIPYPREGDTGWMPGVAFTTKAECDQSARRLVERMMKEHEAGQAVQMMLPACYPDTVDRRGPR